MENNKNRVSGFSIIAMLRQFLERLRQWIRSIWQKGQTKSETESRSASPTKVSQPKSAPPRETLETDAAECVSDPASSAPMHTPAPETACGAQEPSVDDETWKKTPSVHEATQSAPTQQGLRVAGRDAETVVQADAVSRDEPPEESSTVDYTTHERAAVVEEHVQKQVHTVYHLERTRSNHTHEHFYHIQPIVDTSEDQAVHVVDK